MPMKRPVFRYKVRLPPGTRIPKLFQTLQFLVSNHAMFSALSRRYDSDVVRVNLPRNNHAVVINDPEEGELFARVKVPAVLPRLIPLPSSMCDGPEQIPPERRHCLVWLEQVIAENVDALFPGMEVVEAYVFRITRNADMEIQEEEAADLLRTIEQGVRQRRFGASVRLSIEHGMPPRIRELLLANLKLTADDLYLLSKLRSAR